MTVGYERIRGLRAIGERRGGTFEASKSRTFAVPAKALFDAFADASLRRRWLDQKVVVRKATSRKPVRMTWPDGTSVDAWITAKGAAKSSVAIQHGKLPSKEAAANSKAFWADRLDALQGVLNDR